MPLGGTVILVPLVARRLTQINVSGLARTAAGSLARGFELSPALFGEQGQMYEVPSVTSDAEGRFHLRLWRGERYRITAGSRFRPDAELEFVATDQPLVVTVVAR
jgi:hypothetical protein